MAVTELPMARWATPKFPWFSLRKNSNFATGPDPLGGEREEGEIRVKTDCLTASSWQNLSCGCFDALSSVVHDLLITSGSPVPAPCRALKILHT